MLATVARRCGSSTVALAQGPDVLRLAGVRLEGRRFASPRAGGRSAEGPVDEGDPLRSVGEVLDDLRRAPLVDAIDAVRLRSGLGREPDRGRAVEVRVDERELVVVVAVRM